MKYWSIFFACLLISCHRAMPPDKAPAIRPVTAEGMEVPSGSPPAPTPASSVDSELPLKAEVVPLPEPHRYRVELSWHGAPAKAQAWKLTREDEAHGERTLTEGPESLRAWQDNEVSEGKGYRYSLWMSQGGELTLHSHFAVRVPRDRVVDAVEVTDHIEGFRRLFLAASARLRPTTALTIDVDEIVSDGATIESFEKEAAATTGDGRPGAPIVVRAREGRGKLTVLSRGEHGANGGDGRKGAAGNNGRPARDAYTERRFRAPADMTTTLMGLSLCYLFPRCNSLTKQEDVDRFYELARQKIAAADAYSHPTWTQLFVCQHNADVGQDGSPGENGQDGGQGGNGGDTSSVFIQVHDVKDFTVKVEHEPGMPGHGGAGAAGGSGGMGSRSGKPDPAGICPAVTPYDGKEGPPGSPGKPGKDGRGGSASPACLRLGGVAHGDCSAIPGA